MSALSPVFGLGCKKDPAHKRTQQPSRRLLGAAPTPPKDASLEHFQTGIMNQGQSGSCTGHGGSQGVWTACAAAGRPLPWVPSPDGLYRDERCLESPAKDDGSWPDLTDSGAAPADLFRVLAECGMRPMQAPTSDGRYSDVETDPVVLNRRPLLNESDEEALTLVTGGYRIDERSANAITQVCAAIAAGFPVGLGFFCDSAFQRWGDGWSRAQAPLSSVDLTDTNGGGHWVVLTSYRTDGGIIMRGPNSWSTGWGDRGHFEVTPAWLLRAAWDIYVFNVDKATDEHRQSRSQEAA